MFRNVKGVAILAMVLLATPGWAFPAMSVPETQQETQQQKTARGKVTASDSASLTLEVVEAGETRTLKFDITQETRVEGEVKQGAQATVVYRAEASRNVAISVTIAATTP
ncbi:MAG TPA: hypothetical protein VGA40_05630 [Candidatus Acidoferrales bacterium]